MRSFGFGMALVAAVAAAAAGAGGAAAAPGKATAELYVAPKVQVDQKFSADASQSTGTNYRGEADDTFGIVNYSWDFGDGSGIIAGEYHSVVEHAYREPGTYKVRLVVSDASGASSETTMTVVAEQLPVAVVKGNNAAAIAAAIASLKGKPGIVRLPAGKFTIDKTISIPSNTALEGAGPTQTELVHATANQYVVRTAYPEAHNVRVANMLISGPKAVNTTEFGVLVSNSHNFHLTGTRVTGFRNAMYTSQASGLVRDNAIVKNYTPGSGYGISMSNESYLMITRNMFSGNRHSVAANGLAGSLPANTGYDIVDNVFVADTDASVDAHPGAAGRLRVINNQFRAMPYGALFQNGWGLLRGNRFNNVSKYIVRFGPNSNNDKRIANSGVRDFRVDGNILTGSPYRIWFFESRANIVVDCASMDRFNPPNKTNTKPPLQEIIVTWNRCTQESVRAPAVAGATTAGAAAGAAAASAAKTVPARGGAPVTTAPTQAESKQARTAALRPQAEPTPQQPTRRKKKSKFRKFIDRTF